MTAREKGQNATIPLKKFFGGMVSREIKMPSSLYFQGWRAFARICAFFGFYFRGVSIFSEKE